MKYKLIDTVSIPQSKLSTVEIIEHVKQAFGSAYDDYEVVYHVTERNAPNRGNVVVEVWQVTNGYSHY